MQHAHYTRLNAQHNVVPITLDSLQPSEKAVIDDIKNDLSYESSHPELKKQERMMIVTRIFNNVFKSAKFLLWRHPRLREVIQQKVNEFSKQKNIYENVDRPVYEKFIEALYKVQAIC